MIADGLRQGSATGNALIQPAQAYRGPPPRIAHIITGLYRGGAEAALFTLVRATRQSWDPVVISLTDAGFYGERFRALGVEVLCCRMNERGQALVGFTRLLRFLRRKRPEVVQTWMYHADLLGGLAARLLGQRAIVWGIRNLRFHPGRESRSARTASRLCALLSARLPAAIVSCSVAAAREHERRGYATARMRVIPNGYDAKQWHLDRSLGQALRALWNVGAEQRLIGMAARWDPLKDHSTLLAAVAPLMRTHTEVRCVLVGAGMTAENTALRDLLLRHSLLDKVVLAGPRDDMPAVMNALDLHVLTSVSEAFPNVVAEAMACGTPCVVTDVGDAANIVGEQGWCVPPGDSAALYSALERALLLLGGPQVQQRREACRARILQEFTLEKMASAYEEAWSNAVAVRPR
jgi:glycosyltransferase involved in cell wall biosynthesis